MYRRATKRFWILFDSLYHLAPQQKGLIPANVETMTRITLQAKSMCFISGSEGLVKPQTIILRYTICTRNCSNCMFSVCNEHSRESGTKPPILDSADIKYIGRSTEDRISIVADLKMYLVTFPLQCKLQELKT